MQQGAVSQWLAAPCLNGFSFLMNIVHSRAWKTENIDNDANWYRIVNKLRSDLREMEQF